MPSVVVALTPTASSGDLQRRRQQRPHAPRGAPPDADARRRSRGRRSRPASPPRHARHDVAQQGDARGALVGGVGVGEQRRRCRPCRRRPARRRSRRAWRRRRRSDRRSPSRRRSRAPQSTRRRSGGEPVRVETDADPRRQPRSPTTAGRSASGRSAGVVILTLACDGGHDDHAGAGAFEHRGVVGRAAHVGDARRRPAGPPP